MIISFTEPVLAPYIYIHPSTNKVHLLVPVVGGQEISTDNTCKANVAPKRFFEGGALSELNTYKQALTLDISLLKVGDPLRILKEERLRQIDIYIDAVLAMKDTYGPALRVVQSRPSNLYSIQLRPRDQDNHSEVVNPVFNIERKDGEAGPLSALYNAMHSQYPSVTIAVPDPRTRLKAAVEATLSQTPTFEEIQAALTTQCLSLFGLNVDFTKQTNGTEASKAVIEETMCLIIEPATEGQSPVLPTAEEYKIGYIDGLLGACALNIWGAIPTPIFYSIPEGGSVDDRTERLSIMTQFFLANMNVYCKSHGISSANFGTILDASAELSDQLVAVVFNALTAGDDVEQAMGDFFNENAPTFGLLHPLTPAQLWAIKEQFKRTYHTVTATAENHHMDEFMILDTDARGDDAIFVAHQGAICVNFAEVVDRVAVSINPGYFQSVRADFAEHSVLIPHKNDCIRGEIEVELETLVDLIDDEFFKALPSSLKDTLKALPSFQVRQFLHAVAKGKQDEAECLLTEDPSMTQTLLRTPRLFIDYSGRTFNCTAYEYAYWARDTHMCRMLAMHMDEDTKPQMLELINANEATGLVFQQNGDVQRSAHFELNRLESMLRNFVSGYERWTRTKDWNALRDAWMRVGMAQRDLPAHIAQEFCRRDHSSSEKPQVTDTECPKSLRFINWTSNNNEASLFPLESSHSGLGFDFALVRGDTVPRAPSFKSNGEPGGGTRFLHKDAIADLKEVARLEHLRSSELPLLKDALSSSSSAPGISMK